MFTLLLLPLLPVIFIGVVLVFILIRYFQARRKGGLLWRAVPWLIPLMGGLLAWAMYSMMYNTPGSKSFVESAKLMWASGVAFSSLLLIPTLLVAIADEAWGIVAHPRRRAIIVWAALAAAGTGLLSWSQAPVGSLDAETLRKANLAIEYEYPGRYVHGYVTRGAEGIPRIMALSDNWIAGIAGRGSDIRRPEVRCASATAQLQGILMSFLTLWSGKKGLDRHEVIFDGWCLLLTLLSLWTALCALEGIMAILRGRGGRVRQDALDPMHFLEEPAPPKTCEPAEVQKPRYSIRKLIVDESK